MICRERWLWALAAATGLLLALLLTWSPKAMAAPLPPLLWQVPEDGQSGSEGGRLLGPSAVASDPGSGHLFVADALNARIAEFDSWGTFVKAWGWGVVASGPGNKPPRNERQELDVSGVGNPYQIAYINAFSSQNGDSGIQKTELLSTSASAANLQTALEGLESLEPGDVAVSGPAGGPYEVEFTGGYADSAIPPLQMIGAVSSSANTLQNGGSFEVCTAAEGDTCQAGQKGGYEPGQLAGLLGIAVDGAGNLYTHEVAPGSLGEEESLRVQKFDLDGNFQTMWGGEVNKTTGADICTNAQVEAGDECGSGVPGSGPGEFQLAAGPNFGIGIDVGPEGHVFVGGIERIQEFEPDGKAVLPSIEVAGETLRELVIDDAGDFYVTFRSTALGEGGVKQGIRKLDSDGDLVQTLASDLQQVSALAVGVDQSLYAAARPVVQVGALPPVSIVKYDSAGNRVIGPEDGFGVSSGISGMATSKACGISGEDLYASSKSETKGDVVRAYGPPPDPGVCPPPKRPPAITDSYASSVSPEAAVVRSRINPRFWTDTRYRVEYGTGKCSEGGCSLVQPDASGTLLSDQVTDSSLLTKGVFLPDLTPATTYYYRFVAESSGGGPTIGPERSFTTFSLPSQPNVSCPNQAFRTGVAAILPDCRAYEMVTPVDKAGADVIAVRNESYTFNRAALDQASIDGERLTYSSYRAFGDSQSAAFSSQYMATRTQGGWSSHGIAPPRGQLLILAQSATDTQFKAFTPDLCSAWVRQETDALLAPGALLGFPNMYRRDNCGAGAGTYEALTTVPPSEIDPKTYLPELQGISADGAHAIFIAPTGIVGGKMQWSLFDSTGEGPESPVCILPNGTPLSTSCSAGTFSSDYNHGRTESVSHAISADGSRIFWSATGVQENQGRIYVRVNGKKTTAVSEKGEALTGSGRSQYWTAAADGSRAIFSVDRPGSGQSLESGGADLYEFNVDAKTTSLIASGAYGVLGASEDAKRIYFVSRENLATGAVVGEPNLYLHDAGSSEYRYLGTLSKQDVKQAGNVAFSPVNVEASKHTARVTPNGEALVFMSTAALTGADNSDAVSGVAVSEVFRFDAASDQLACLSCNPTGARPVGRNISEPTLPFWAAGRLPAVQSQMYPISRAMSETGSRVFFESFQALVPNDTNGASDVYQWESPGEGDCTEESEAFSKNADGCVSLISSGIDAAGASLIDTDPSGSNVFFSTQSSLLPQDPGLVDIYDARVGGGFPSLPSGGSGCEGEACQGPVEVPGNPVPGSSSFQGQGNVAKHAKKKKHKKHQKKNKHRNKKQKKQKKGQNAQQKRGAGR